MTKKFFAIAIFALAFLVWPTLSVAQELYATLTGTVTDPSGAVVPGATVLIHNNDTNTDVRTVTTDASGNYTATNLPAATYTVTIKTAGFRTFTSNNLTLHVAEKRTLNASLEAGQVTETVTVQASTTPIQTSTAAQAGTITGQQVRELELNNRNFEQLVLLQPGVTNGLPDQVGFGLSNSTTISVNGARVTANNWTVDGADINDSGSNGTLLNVPSVDAIQEFTLQRSTYDAQYGRSGGGQVLVATKSGTSEFHGSAYEFVRNDYFNANDFFSNSTGTPRAIERYNNFGFTVGGPLFVPKLYSKTRSKTFFFWSEEWRKTSTPNAFSAVAPTATELSGVVPGTITGPAAPGCATFNAGTNTTTINPACYSANAKVYLTNIFDKFAANSGSNYITNFSQKNNFRQDIVRIDQTISDKIHFFARFMQDDVPENFPQGLFAGGNYPGVSNVALDAPGKNVVGNLSWTLSPRAVNETEVAYSWGAIDAALSGPAVSPAFVNALTPTAFQDPYHRIPSVSITGIQGFSEGVAPYFERNLDRNIFDNFSFTAGNHTFRAGISAQWMLKTENASNGAASFSFNTFGDFLLGNAASYSQSSRDIVPDLHYVNLEGYVQDDWKVTPRLTLNFGLRYSFFPSPSDVHNTLNNFDPLLYNPAAAPLIDPATGNFVAGQGIVPATYTNGIIFPVGGACNAAKAISPQVTCSPYGSLVNPNSNNNFAPRFGFAWDPTGRGKTAIRGGYGIFYDRTLNGMWEQNAFTNPPLVQSTNIQNTSFDNPLAGTLSLPLGPNILESTGRPTFKVPSYQDFNFSIQQEILPNTEFEIAYVGGLGRHLLGEADLNEVPVAVRQANPDVNVNAIRPFLGYAFFKSRLPEFLSNYNSLQISLNRHVSQGLTIGIAYTWSRLLTNASVDRDVATYNTYNFAQSYGPGAYNTPHVFVASYVYQLPFFRDQKGVIGHVLGGWELSGITTVQTGQSQTITQGTDPFSCSTSVTTGLCVPGSAPGTYPGGIGIGQFNGSVQVRPDAIASPSGPGTLAEWFNTAAFVPAVGHFGSAGVGTFLGPGLQNWDLAAIRNIKIAERFSLQFRGEFFNAFNHTNWSGIDTGINDASFGQVTSTHNPRNIQLGLKLYF